MRYRNLKALVVMPAVVMLLLTASSAGTQADAAMQRYLLARATYYTPTADGLRTFDCKVSADWKDFLSRASGKDIGEDHPAVKYLNSVNITVHNTLRSKAEVHWGETAPAPANLQDGTTKMREGIAQMLEGYFQSWNAYLNGAMVPLPDKSTKISFTPEGTHLAAIAPKMSVDEDFDKNMLLTRVHVLTDGNDTIAMPTFTDTARGRTISEVRSEVRQPQTAPPVYITLAAKYQTVAGYEIPSVLHFEVQNVTQLDFALTGCVVNTASPAAETNKP